VVATTVDQFNSWQNYMVSLDEDDYGDTHFGSASVKRRIEPQRVMLIVTSTASVSDRLIEAVEREFPRVLVEQVDDVDAACVRFSHPVALILVDFPLMKQAEAASDGLRRMHPNALTAVIEPNEKGLVAPLAGIADSSLIRGVLPMDLRLDIWLSIIRLMLCGGEYFPPGAMIHTPANDPGTDRTPREASAPHLLARQGGMTTLTARELQILAMAAQGLQNKLIAAEFRLSEHTVKVHLHNIIRKLGVHNRTEAAARFRNATAAVGA
jgi:DNA-binding NarL/FixJ family response regulator